MSTKGIPMTDNLYFLFLDEIYTPNLNEFRKYSKVKIETDKYHHHFGIAGVILAASHLERLNFRSRKMKKKFYPDKEILIFHYSDILNNKRKRNSFITSLTDLVKDTDFKYSCVFIDKHELIKKYGTFDNSGKIILDLFIVPKSLNYIGTQLADLVIYPTYDGVVSAHNVRTDHFVSYEKTLKTKLLKEGVTVIP